MPLRAKLKRKNNERHTHTHKKNKKKKKPHYPNPLKRETAQYIGTFSTT